MGVSMGLQLSEFDENNMQSIKKEMILEDLQELKDINAGEISLDIVYCYVNSGKLEVRAFLRNGRSSDLAVNEMFIDLFDINKEEVVSSTIINLPETFGKIKSNSAVYLDLFFDIKDGAETEKENLNLAWRDDVIIGEEGEVNFPFLEKVGPERKMLEIYINDLGPIIKDTIKFDTFSIGEGRGDILEILFMARNSFEKAVSVTKFPMKILCGQEVLMDKVFNTEFIRLGANEGMILRFPVKKEFLSRTDFKFEEIDIIYG